jgi:hypothetical protein
LDRCGHSRGKEYYSTLLIRNLGRKYLEESMQYEEPEIEMIVLYGCASRELEYGL